MAVDVLMQDDRVVHVSVGTLKVPMLREGAVHVKTLSQKHNVPMAYMERKLSPECFVEFGGEKYITADGVKAYVKSGLKKFANINSTANRALDKLNAKLAQPNVTQAVIEENAKLKQQLNRKEFKVVECKSLKEQGQFLKLLRVDANLTQKVVEQGAGIKGGYLSRMENVGQYIDRYLDNLCVYWGLTVEQLQTCTVPDNYKAPFAMPPKPKVSYPSKAVGAFIRKLRLQSGLPARCVAESIGATAQAVYNMESSGSGVTKHREKLIEFWGLTKQQFDHRELPDGWVPPKVDNHARETKQTPKPQQTKPNTQALVDENRKLVNDFGVLRGQFEEARAAYQELRAEFDVLKQEALEAQDIINCNNKIIAEQSIVIGKQQERIAEIEQERNQMAYELYQCTNTEKTKCPF